mgnify:CR=1 FL=1
MLVLCKKDLEFSKLGLKFIEGEVYALSVQQNMITYWIGPGKYQSLSINMLKEHFTKFEF